MPHATRILDEMALAAAELSALSELAAGQLIVGASDTLACYFLPPVFAAFRARYPRVELRIDNRPSPVIAERVSEREVDIGIVSLPLPAGLEVSGRKVDERIDTVVLAPQEDVAVCAATHPLVKRRVVSVRDLAHCSLLLLATGTSSRALLAAAFAAEKTPLRVAMDTSSVEVLKRLAELDFGVAIVPRIAVERELASGALHALELRGFGAERSVGALTPRAFSPTRAASAFLALARSYSRPKRSSSASSSS